MKNSSKKAAVVAAPQLVIGMDVSNKKSMLALLEGDEMRFTNLCGCWFLVHPDGRVEAGDPVHPIDPQVFGDTL